MYLYEAGFKYYIIQKRKTFSVTIRNGRRSNSFKHKTHTHTHKCKNHKYTKIPTLKKKKKKIVILYIPCGLIICSIHNAYYNGGLARLLFITIGGRCDTTRVAGIYCCIVGARNAASADGCSIFFVLNRSRNRKKKN